MTDADRLNWLENWLSHSSTHTLGLWRGSFGHTATNVARDIAGAPCYDLHALDEDTLQHAEDIPLGEGTTLREAIDRAMKLEEIRNG